MATENGLETHGKQGYYMPQKLFYEEGININHIS